MRDFVEKGSVLVFCLGALAWIGIDGAVVTGELTFAERGRPAWPISLPESPAPAEAYAAEVLRDAMAQMVGTAPRIVRGPVAGSVIALSSGRDVSDGFSLEARANRLEIRGQNPRGTLYGVYDLLERFCGCGWYTPWRTVLPRQDRLSVPDGLAVRETPAFVLRQPSWYGVRTNQLFASRCRLNGESPDGAVPHPDPKYGGCPLRFVRRLYTSHTFLTLVPPERYFKSHPEYFSMIGGRRRDGRTQLCCSNPEVIELVTTNALALAAADPTAEVVGISPMDWYDFCECPACRAIVEKEGSEAGLMLTLVNAVAERIAKVRPELKVETLVYGRTLVPPKTVRPRENVIICSCAQVDWGEPLVSAKRPGNVSWREQYERWTSWTRDLYQWDYTVNFLWFNQPFLNFDVLGPNVRFFRDHGVRYLYMDGAPLPAADFGDLKCWLLAKLAWNPDLPVDELVDRFLVGCYGAGASHVRAAYDLERRQKLIRPDLAVDYWQKDDPERFSDGFYDRLLEAWNRAEVAVQNDPDALFAVLMGKYSPVAANLQRLLKRVPMFSATRRPDRFVRPARLATLLEEELSIRTVAASRGVDLHYSLNRGYDRWMSNRINGLRTSDEVKASDRTRMTVESCYFRNGDYTGGEWNEKKDYFARLVADAGSFDGQAVEIYPTDGIETVVWFFDDVASDPDAQYRMRLRVKPTKIEGARGTALQTLFWNEKREKTIVTDVESLSDDWSWIDLGVRKLRKGDRCLLILSDSISSPVRAVRVCALEIVRQVGS